jgi:excisionase family DNA binding protein
MTAADLQLYDLDEAAVILNVKKHWLQAKVAKQEIPHRRVGKFIRFSAEDLLEIQQPVRPAAERLPKQHTTATTGGRRLRSA